MMHVLRFEGAKTHVSIGLNSSIGIWVGFFILIPSSMGPFSMMTTSNG